MGRALKAVGSHVMAPCNVFQGQGVNTMRAKHVE